MSELPKPTPGIFHWLRNKLVAGLFVALPIILTFWIIKSLYTFINGPCDFVIRAWVKAGILPMSTYFEEHQDGTIPGAGFIMTLLLLMLTGVIATNLLGARLILLIDQILLKIPVIKSIYHALKQATQAIQDFGGSDGRPRFNQVVYLPLGSGQILGFVTGQFTDTQGVEQCNVFAPTSPSPLTGLLLIIRKEDLVLANISVEDATKFIISMGLVSPTKMASGPRPTKPTPPPADTTQRH